jgi:hypothetical protein
MVETDPTPRALAGFKTKGSKSVSIGEDLDDGVLDPFDRHRQGVNIRDLRDLTDHMLPKFRSNSDFVLTLNGVDFNPNVYDDSITPITKNNIGNLSGNQLNLEINSKISQRLTHETEDRDLGQLTVYDHPNPFEFVDLESEIPFEYSVDSQIIYSQVPRVTPSNKSKVAVAYKGNDGSDTIISYENNTYVNFNIKHIPKQLGSMSDRISYDYSRRTVYIPFENTSGVKNLEASEIVSLLPEITNGSLSASILEGPTSSVTPAVTTVVYILNPFTPTQVTFVFTNNSSENYTLEFQNSFFPITDPGNYEFSYDSIIKKITITVATLSTPIIDFSNLQSYLDLVGLNINVLVPDPFTLDTPPPNFQTFTLVAASGGGGAYLVSSNRTNYICESNNLNFAEELVRKNRIEDLDSRIDVTKAREILELRSNSSILNSSLGVMSDGLKSSELIVGGFDSYELTLQPTKISNSFFDDSFDLIHRKLISNEASKIDYLTESKQLLNSSLESKLDPWVDVSDDRERMFKGKLTNDTEIENVLISTDSFKQSLADDQFSRLRRIWDSNTASEWDVNSRTGFFRESNSNLDSVVYGGLFRS